MRRFLTSVLNILAFRAKLFMKCGLSTCCHALKSRSLMTPSPRNPTLAVMPTSGSRAVLANSSLCRADSTASAYALMLMLCSSASRSRWSRVSRCCPQTTHGNNSMDARHAFLFCLFINKKCIDKYVTLYSTNHIGVVLAEFRGAKVIIKIEITMIKPFIY